MKKVFYRLAAGVLFWIVLTGLSSAFAAEIVQPTITGDLIGQYKARVFVYDTGMPIFLDLSARKADYEPDHPYKNGSIIRYVEVWRSDFTALGGEQDPRRRRSELELYILNGTQHVGTLDCLLEYSRGLGAWKIVETSFTPASDVALFTRGDAPESGRYRSADLPDSLLYR